MQRKEKQLILIAFSLLFICFIILYINNYNSNSNREKIVTTGKIKLTKAGNSTQKFTYEDKTVSTNMNTGCTIPASIKINTISCINSGNIEIYINKNNYATGLISKPGYALLSSGCGCSTVCICEIKTGENILSIISKGFEGEIEFEISVKEG